MAVGAAPLNSSSSPRKKVLSPFDTILTGACSRSQSRPADFQVAALKEEGSDPFFMPNQSFSRPPLINKPRENVARARDTQTLARWLGGWGLLPEKRLR